MQGPWTWANFGTWWGIPHLLQSMGSQRGRHDWVTEQNLALVQPENWACCQCCCWTLEEVKLEILWIWCQWMCYQGGWSGEICTKSAALVSSWAESAEFAYRAGHCELPLFLLCGSCCSPFFSSLFQVFICVSALWVWVRWNSNTTFTYFPTRPELWFISLLWYSWQGKLSWHWMMLAWGMEWYWKNDDIFVLLKFIKRIPDLSRVVSVCR